MSFPPQANMRAAHRWEPSRQTLVRGTAVADCLLGQLYDPVVLRPDLGSHCCLYSTGIKRHRIMVEDLDRGNALRRRRLRHALSRQRVDCELLLHLPASQRGRCCHHLRHRQYCGAVRLLHLPKHLGQLVVETNDIGVRSGRCRVWHALGCRCWDSIQDGQS